MATLEAIEVSNEGEPSVTDHQKTLSSSPDPPPSFSICSPNSNEFKVPAWREHQVSASDDCLIPLSTSIGWMTPSFMFGAYITGEHFHMRISMRTESNFLAALITAIIHIVLFKYLEGRRADGPKSVPQSYVAVASHLLATVFRASLTTALGVAFTQYLWTILRTHPLRIANIELMFRVRQDIRTLFAPGLSRSSPILLFVGLVTWMIPLAVTYPPGALTVASVPHTSLIKITVPTTTPSAADYTTLIRGEAINNAFSPCWGSGIWQFEYVTLS